MDPVSLSLGVLAARVVAKVADKAVDKTAEGAVDAAGGLIGWLLKHLSSTKALEKVTEVPDSPSRVAELGEVIDAEIVDERQVAELQHLVEMVKEQQPGLFQSAVGNRIVQAVNSTVKVNWSGGAEDR